MHLKPNLRDDCPIYYFILKHEVENAMNNVEEQKGNYRAPKHKPQEGKESKFLDREQVDGVDGELEGLALIGVAVTLGKVISENGPEPVQVLPTVMANVELALCLPLEPEQALPAGQLH